MSVVASMVRAAVRGMAHTWRLEVRGTDRVAAARTRGPVLFAVWHGQLLAPLWHRRQEGIVLLVSAHRDAEVLRKAAIAWGYDVAPGSSTRGGAHGLRRVITALRSGLDAAITPDGPRGPARVAKHGVVAAAASGAAAIVPVAARADRAWRFGSWDRFTLPRPGARVRIVYGEPLLIQRDADRARAHTDFERAMQACEAACRA
jgi:lysophospholipid acyltransferase (LPLAT)-like uncharacterized protein